METEEIEPHQEPEQVTIREIPPAVPATPAILIATTTIDTTELSDKNENARNNS